MNGEQAIPADDLKVESPRNLWHLTSFILDSLIKGFAIELDVTPTKHSMKFRRKATHVT